MENVGNAQCSNCIIPTYIQYRRQRWPGVTHQGLPYKMHDPLCTRMLANWQRPRAAGSLSLGGSSSCWRLQYIERGTEVYSQISPIQVRCKEINTEAAYPKKSQWLCDLYRQIAGFFFEPIQKVLTTPLLFSSHLCVTLWLKKREPAKQLVLFSIDCI